MPQLILGCHLSSSKGFLALGRNALHIGANTFQFFTRNPRGSKAKPLDLPDAQALRTLMAAHGFGPVLAHAPYTLNACSADARVREFALETMADDLSRMEALPGNFYNLHPGSHVGQGAEAGISLIANTLNQILWPEQARAARSAVDSKSCGRFSTVWSWWEKWASAWIYATFSTRAMIS